MQISPISAQPYSFKATTDKKQDKNQVKNNDKNPISKSGEKALLVKTTFLAGLGLGAKLLLELIDGDFLIDELGNKAEKIVEKQHKNASSTKKLLLTLGALGGLVAIFIGGFGILYTMFKAPKINYEGNVNAFKKGKDMDVYIQGNKAEKEIYTQMNEKAKTANEEEKAKLKDQYMQMQMAKNKLPDFIRQK